MTDTTMEHPRFGKNPTRSTLIQIDQITAWIREQTKPFSVMDAFNAKRSWSYNTTYKLVRELRDKNLLRQTNDVDARPALWIYNAPTESLVTITTKSENHLTQQELCDEARRRFGDDTKQWAFICPKCSDIACAADFIAIGADPYLVGQECIGRSCGALAKAATGTDGRQHAKRGCDWAAYGLFAGPWFITVPTKDGGTKELPSFKLAPHRAPQHVREPAEVIA
ncbi:hypothetical protein BBK82_03635 [Lentzea guizhouensis]|uniref:Uncharacterized protein n=1 Tax=Lentzea guizhouensis TaxID=1586287 RepID=A0A1B2HC61_9PSEU|nr:VVA0879 family protein [Lentzea guizhouensis]ANZ35308.1 hypothetical protein BBK82_03635 [Lentzea guizhouensis]